MDWIALENFRCFKDTGRVALRPLNLHVGENSSGKTTFLAALRLAGQFLNEKIDFKNPNLVPWPQGVVHEWPGNYQHPCTEEVARKLLDEAPPCRPHPPRAAR